MSPTEFIPSQVTFEKIICSMQEGLVVCDVENRVHIMNAAAMKIFGYTDQREVLGKHITEVLDDAESASHFLAQFNTEAQVNQMKITFNQGGKKNICSIAAFHIPDAAGNVLKAILMCDITEREITEQKLQEYAARLEKSNKELDQFAYIVSHDLKAPLRAIINLSQWLQEDLSSSLSDDNKRNLDMLKNRTFRMEALINGILEYSKIGRSKVSPELVDVESLVTEVCDSLMPPAHVVVETSALPVISTRKIMLYQVLSNLISNAIKYNNNECCLVKVYGTELKDAYEFTVEDNGPGIAKEFHEKIFIIFHTLQSRDKVESSGIGLTIVKRIIEEEGGQIRIESAEGMGSKFIFQWPKQQ